MSRPYTPEEDAHLRCGLEAGLTYAQIGAPIGRTRKSISGRVHTLNLPKRRQPLEAPRNALCGPEPLEALTPYLVPEPRPEGCQHITGDPREPGWFKCGRPIVRGPSPYCAEHMVKCWYMPEPQRKTRPAPRPELRTDFA